VREQGDVGAGPFLKLLGKGVVNTQEGDVGAGIFLKLLSNGLINGLA